MDYSSLSCDELLRACADPENTEAWQELVRRFNTLITVTVWRVASRYSFSRSSIIEDLVQDTYTKICAKSFRLMRTFKSEHSNACYGMVKTIARNVAIDYFRNPCPDDSCRPDVEPIDGESSHFNLRSTGMNELDRQIVLQQIDRIDKILKKHCSQRDQDIFWLYYLQEFSAREIAELPNFKPLTVKGIESILYRVKRLICEQWEEED
ncbi:MAG: sigma-70 family RNA polymerase sigma factor [Candidatus Angelobacter sp.]